MRDCASGAAPHAAEKQFRNTTVDQLVVNDLVPNRGDTAPGVLYGRSLLSRALSLSLAVSGIVRILPLRRLQWVAAAALLLLSCRCPRWAAVRFLGSCVSAAEAVLRQKQEMTELKKQELDVESSWA